MTTQREWSFEAAEAQVQVNSYAAGDQERPAITALTGGGYVVTWQSETGQDGSGSGVYMQVYDAAGAKVGGETRVNATTAGDQRFSSVAGLADGGFVVTWSSAGSGISLCQQRYDAAGAAVGGESVVKTGVFNGTVAIGLADGGWLVGWNAIGKVALTRYDADGDVVASEIQVGASDQTNAGPQLTALPDGGYVVLWSVVPPGGGPDMTAMVQSFGADGSARGSAVSVHAGSLGTYEVSGMAALADGGFVIAGDIMHFEGDAGTVVGLFVRRFDASGLPLGKEVLVDIDLSHGPIAPRVAALADGGFVIGWMESETNGGPLSLHGQAFDPDGAARGASFMISDPSVGSQLNPAMTTLADGRYVVAWENYLGDGSGMSVFSRTLGAGHDAATEGNDALYGTIGNDTLSGLGGDDRIKGYAGNDRLDGGAGADIMTGGAGDDSYWVDDSGDRVVEAARQGVDTVYAAISWSLGDRPIENLVLTGTGDTTATGNALRNWLTGNGGNNVLDGGGGTDFLTGGAGDDSYYVDNAGDRVYETAGQGVDTVYASVSFSLGNQHVENLVLTGTGNTTATGNGLQNVLTGNGGNNVLDGGRGADILSGGAGDDSYWIDNPGDQVVESAGGGHDVVYASVRVTLSDAVEDLVITGSASVAGIGNGLDNRITGNGGNNILLGGGGADILTGGGGNDRLIGGGGADRFVFAAGSGVDRIDDFSAAEGDVIDLHAYSGGVVGGGGVTTAISGHHVLIDLGGGQSVIVLYAAAGYAGLLDQIVW